MIPVVSSLPRNAARRGRRRSQLTTTTLSPALARTTPRLATVEVFPSFPVALVTRIVLSCASWPANSREVRSDR